ncbi:LysR family transcriptional regulator [Pseudonocardia spinosispora]|uniref:LysR family transcriptional regulator n=1 Tax=Pseudonocardia spinosispora TaxID=103441 RepID=UPI0004096EB7|nr:LysR family transcriptional regulator [Pseudonocardia spinosispora]
MAYPRPRFTLAQLQYFIATAETGSISTAAQQLHASQSAMSSAIHRLERELGCDLFIRHHARGVSLSANGRRLLDEARTLLHDALAFQENARSLQGSLSGELHAGCFVTLAPFYLPPVLTRLRSRHAGLRVQVHETDGAGLHDLLRSGACEIALTYRLDLGDDMAFEHLAQLRPYALVSERHPLAGRSEATLSQLSRFPMIMLDLPESSRFMLGMLARAGARPPEIIRTTSFETMRALVAAGEAFTILNQRPRTPGTEGGRTHEVAITDAEPVVLGLIQVANIRPNRRVLAFGEECRAVAATLTAGT